MGVRYMNCTCCNKEALMPIPEQTIISYVLGNPPVKLNLCQKHKTLYNGKPKPIKIQEETVSRCCGHLVNQYGRCTRCNDQYWKEHLKYSARVSLRSRRDFCFNFYIEIIITKFWYLKILYRNHINGK